jgi:plastocyanin
MMAMFLIACGEEKPLTFDVQVGDEDKVQGLAIQTFLPGDLTVNVGDTIRFTKRTGEPHTVTFNVPDPKPPDFLPRPDGNLEANPAVFFPSPPPPPPSGPPPAGPPPPANLSFSFDGAGYLNSGFLSSSSDVINVTFTKTGTFAYLCLLHPTHMKGTITVKDEGGSRPKKADAYAKEGADHLAVHKSNAKAFRDAIQVPAPTVAAGGTRNSPSGPAPGMTPRGTTSSPS